MLTSQALSVAISSIIFCCCALGLCFSLFHFYLVSKVKVKPEKRIAELIQKEVELDDETKSTIDKVYEIYQAIYNGAYSFLFQEYSQMSIFIIVFSILIVCFIGATNDWFAGLFTAIAFVAGASTSIICGFIGMTIGVYANARTAIQAQKDLQSAFKLSFGAAIVMGFVLCSLGLFMLYLVISLFEFYYSNSSIQLVVISLFEAVSGFGLGASSIGLFGRVGGGIYTKAADVGADLVGKLEAGIPEDDIRNPASIADNVGDNVGDIAGMGADLFGSFSEATCAALVIGSQSVDIWNNRAALFFPLLISACGIIVCLLTTVIATNLVPTKKTHQIEPSLKRQILISTILMTPVLYVISTQFLPNKFNISRDNDSPLIITNTKVFISAVVGLWNGLIIGVITEYYTSQAYRPVQEVAESSDTGAATVIIYGLALGYRSVVVPLIGLCVTIYVSHVLAGFYGIAIAALGILSTLSIGLTIDAYGPICDNAGGIAEMANLGPDVRELTDALDSAGNTTAAIGKGSAIASAALVSIALFSAFITVRKVQSINILDPLPMVGLLTGGSLAYLFVSWTVNSVGKAANTMVEEVRRQFASNPMILSGKIPPDYDSCIKISTEASLREMRLPGALVLLTPLFFGFFLGSKALAGLLVGALVTGVCLAISSSNTGGAWDNAKKYVEADRLGPGKGKHSSNHMATVIGDTVGDPLKDTSGPSLNILIKLMAIISLVFARVFPAQGYIERYIV